VICSTSIERIVTGRNAALAQIETLIQQLDDISTLTRSIGGKTALDWAMKQDFRCGCWLMENQNGDESHYPQSRSRYMAGPDEEVRDAFAHGCSGS
jgi:hypothetical protein